MRFLLLLGVAALLHGCASAPSDTVNVVVVNKIVDDQGNYVIEEQEEIARKSLDDTDVASVLPPARVHNYGRNFFEHYSVGQNGVVAVTRFNKVDGDYVSSDIWLSKVRLTNSDVFFETPSFSSDGRYIYATSYKRDSLYRNLWKMRADGIGGRIKIGQQAYLRNYPQESFDGSKLLYGEDGAIWISTPTGNLPTQIAKGIYPSWLGADRILYAAKDEVSNKYSIWSIKTDGTQLTQLFADNEHHLLDPASSADGRYVAYVQQREEDQESRDVFIYDVETGTTRQVTTNLSRDDMPKWAPDGNYLYFRSSRGGQWSIWRIDTSFLYAE